MRQVPRRHLAGWLLFSGLHLVNALFHRQWADELQAWSIVRESSNFSELHWHLHQDGHPALWYLLQWPLRFITANPGAQQVVASLFAVSILALLWFRSPFGLAEKVLLSLSFQLGYNLSVVSRSYVLGTFLLFLFVALMPRYKDRPWLGWTVLALLCNVQILYAPLSYCLALLWIDSADSRKTCLSGLSFYALGVYWCSATVLLNLRLLPGPVSHWFILAPAVVVTSLLLVAILGKPGPRGIAVVSWAALPPLGFVFTILQPGKANIAASVSNLGRGVLPVVNPLQPDYWHLGMPDSVGVTLALVAGLAICLYLRPQPFLVALLGLHAGVVLLISCYLHPGFLWHAGVFFTGFLSIVWFARGARLTLGPGWLLLLLLVPQALVGTNAMARSKWTPISSSYATANWIREQEIPPERLMGFRIFPTLGVAAYLEEPFYFPEMKRETAVFDWQSGAKPKQAAGRIAKRMRELQLDRAYLVAPEGVEALRDWLAFFGVSCSELYLSPNSLRGRYQVWELQLSVPSPP